MVVKAGTADATRRAVSRTCWLPAGGCALSARTELVELEFELGLLTVRDEDVLALLGSALKQLCTHDPGRCARGNILARGEEVQAEEDERHGDYGQVGNAGVEY
jgi:hypothetical protein